MSFRAITVLWLAVILLALGTPGFAIEHVVLVVWDGMRPDMVNEANCPTLTGLAGSGVFFRNNHAVYPSATNVNGATLLTGNYPARTGIISNQEYRPELDPVKPFDTSDFPELPQSELARYISAPTIAEVVQGSGGWTAVAGSKPVAQFADRARSRSSPAAKQSITIYRGKVWPISARKIIERTIGPIPLRKKFPNESEDSWTTRALTDVLWKDGVPKFSLLWLSEPDLSQHEEAPGSPLARAAIKLSDDNLARVLSALKEKNALTSTDIFVVSDHGFSTIERATDLAKELRAAGFDAVRSFTGEPKNSQVLVASVGGSTEFYVVGHGAATVRKLVESLKHSGFAGVIVTREPMEGTFTLKQLHIDSATAPDVVVASRWNDGPNKFGIRGEIESEVGKVPGQGTHATFSPHDLNNTLIASGPDFRRGWNDLTPSGNQDVAPTILHLLGLKAPAPMDGRVLHEAFADSPDDQPVVHEKILEASSGPWHQHLRLTTVEGATYFMEGNGSLEPEPRNSH